MTGNVMAMRHYNKITASSGGSLIVHGLRFRSMAPTAEYRV